MLCKLSITSTYLSIVLLLVDLIACGATIPRNIRSTPISIIQSLKGGGNPETMSVIDDQEQYFDLLKETSTKLHVVEFSAQWCGACKKLKDTGIFDELKASEPHVAWHSVDIDEVDDLAAALKINSVPTFVMIANGKVSNRFSSPDPVNFRAQFQAFVHPESVTASSSCCGPDQRAKGCCPPAPPPASVSNSAGGGGGGGSGCCAPKANNGLEKSGTHEKVSEYYGKDLTSSSDLSTTACMTSLEETSDVRKCLANVHPEIKDKFYGCGSPLPPLLSGCTVLDLGCGTGRDCYVASQLVGPEGRVIGVDMTTEQLAVARKYEEHHRQQFGYPTKNTEFHHGLIENLRQTTTTAGEGEGEGKGEEAGGKVGGIESNSVDVVISNCVINLSPNKRAVFSEIWRILRKGGEVYFSDVVSDRRLPAAAREDKEALGECLGGCVYMGDMVGMMAKAGFTDVRIKTHRQVEIHDPRLVKVLGGSLFYSVTVRAFKLPSTLDPPTTAAPATSTPTTNPPTGPEIPEITEIADLVEPSREDYGQIATYLGSVPNEPHAFYVEGGPSFPLVPKFGCSSGGGSSDVNNPGLARPFVTSVPTPVDKNTALILTKTRYKSAFRVTPPLTHLGPFAEGGRWLPVANGASTGNANGGGGGGGCC